MLLILKQSHTLGIMMTSVLATPWFGCRAVEYQIVLVALQTAKQLKKASVRIPDSFARTVYANAVARSLSFLVSSVESFEVRTVCPGGGSTS